MANECKEKFERRIEKLVQSQVNSNIHLKIVKTVNSLTPKSDQHLNSPYNITPESHIKVMRIKKNDHQLKKLLTVRQSLLVSTLGNV